MDNNGNSKILKYNDTNGVDIVNTTYLVDECEEDRVPPTIGLATEIPIVGFKTPSEARQWFSDNSVTSDDCKDTLVLELGIVTRTSSLDPTSYQITNRVYDPVCAALPEVDAEGLTRGSYEHNETYYFKVDGTPPTVLCGFDKPQDICFVLDPLFIPNGKTTPVSLNKKLSRTEVFSVSNFLIWLLRYFCIFLALSRRWKR